MQERSYWRITFTGTSWQEFIDSGANVYGLKERYKTSLALTKPGDYLICYVAGISRFIGLLEVTSPPFYDNSLIWTFEIYPLRLKVKPIIVLTPETAIPVIDFKERLSIFLKLKNPSKWSMAFRNTFMRMTKEDGEIVIGALSIAQNDPISRPFNRYLLNREPL